MIAPSCSSRTSGSTCSDGSHHANEAASDHHRTPTRLHRGCFSGGTTRHYHILRLTWYYRARGNTFLKAEHYQSVVFGEESIAAERRMAATSSRSRGRGEESQVPPGRTCEIPPGHAVSGYPTIACAARRRHARSFHHRIDNEEQVFGAQLMLTARSCGPSHREKPDFWR